MIVNYINININRLGLIQEQYSVCGILWVINTLSLFILYRV